MCHGCLPAVSLTYRSVGTNLSQDRRECQGDGYLPACVLCGGQSEKSTRWSGSTRNWTPIGAADLNRHIFGRHSNNSERIAMRTSIDIAQIIFLSQHIALIGFMGLILVSEFIQINSEISPVETSYSSRIKKRHVNLIGFMHSEVDCLKSESHPYRAQLG